MNILVVDQFDICREGMKNILLSIYESCYFFEASTINEGALIADKEELNLILIDLDMSEENSSKVLDKIENSSLKDYIILMSSQEERELVCRAENMGISAFINKKSSKAIISSVFQIVLAGGRYFSPEIIYDRSIAKKASFNNITSGHLPKLSSRQMDVLKLLAEGKPNKVIARDLNIATGTVKVHIAGILKNLKAKNRTQAVSIANHINLI